MIDEVMNLRGSWRSARRRLAGLTAPPEQLLWRQPIRGHRLAVRMAFGDDPRLLVGCPRLPPARKASNFPGFRESRAEWPRRRARLWRRELTSKASLTAVDDLVQAMRMSGISKSQVSWLPTGRYKWAVQRARYLARKSSRP